jgi:ornithine carbamoyltransferase
VINGLSDLEHPCQALADFQTLKEQKGTLAGLKLAFVGDGNFNMANSLMFLSAKVGVNLSIACPPIYAPAEEILKKALSFAKESGSSIKITDNPKEAVHEADAVYTDAWTSPGQEEERSERLKAFAQYQVNLELLKNAKPDASIMHCLPAHRGEEITSDVLDGPQSIVFDQAENRLHVQKAILSLVL